MLARLDIKHYHQPNALYCVPASVKMCLDYIGKTYKVKGLKPFSINKIAKITKTTQSDGTPLEQITNINQQLQKTRPPIKFINHEGSKITEIENEIKNNMPVIVFIDPKENHTFSDGATLVHAVVVVEYDKVNHTIYYDDPSEDNEATAIQNMDIGTFINRWGIDSRWIQIVLGNKQTYLTGYTE